MVLETFQVVLFTETRPGNPGSDKYGRMETVAARTHLDCKVHLQQQPDVERILGMPGVEAEQHLILTAYGIWSCWVVCLRSG